jgi:mannose-6-phosphate isomerase-like protein (cupin superfamily)
MMELLLAKITEMKAEREKTDTTLKEIRTGQECMKEEMLANNEKFVVLQGTLVCWMDMHEEKMEAYPEKMKENSEDMEFEAEHWKSPRNMLKWKLAEHRISGIGTGIWLQGAAVS